MIFIKIKGFCLQKDTVGKVEWQVVKRRNLESVKLNEDKYWDSHQEGTTINTMMSKENQQAFT